MIIGAKMIKYILFVANRLKLILFVYVLSLLFSSVMFAVIEDKTIFDGFWWSIVTAMTVGYGDIYPTTIAGKVLGIIMMHFWIYGITTMLVANIVTHILVDRNAFTHDEQEWQEEMLIKIAEKLGIDWRKPPKDF